MSYHLLFSLRLEQQSSQVFYDPEAFVGHPIVISVPDVEELVSHFISALETVAIVEKETPKKNASTKLKGTEDLEKPRIIDVNNSSVNTDLNETIVTLRPIAAEAYIRKVQDLDKSAFNRLCSGIATYLSENLSKFSIDNLLEMELNPVFSGLREVIDLRNYLLTFVKNPNNRKNYREGFIYIVVV